MIYKIFNELVDRNFAKQIDFDVGTRTTGNINA